MKKVENCIVENCIPTPSSCVEWNGGAIEYLGICQGDSLNTLVWEIITKLQEVTGEDLSNFDIDSLTEICNLKAPQEITILSILNLVRQNQICLKDFIDSLSEQIASITNTSAININLKCYAEFDNLGNSLSITRDQLDQLIIDNLCAHKLRIETLEGKVINLQSQIDNIDVNLSVDELSFPTCVDADTKPTSSQVISIANAHCDLETSTGDPADISAALANTPGDLNTEFNSIPGWILTPQNWAENYSNLLLEVENLRQRIKTIEDTCCALTCDDISLGFTATYNEDADGIILRFTYGAGTSIPVGFVDQGSTGVIRDVDGNEVEFNLAIVNNLQEEVSIVGLNTTGDLVIEITAILGTDALTCQKCVSKKLTKAACKYCEICAEGDPDASVVIVYESSSSSVVIENTTTTTSTTTTTTAAP